MGIFGSKSKRKFKYINGTSPFAWAVILALLHNLNTEVEITDSREEIESQTEAFAAISVSICYNFEAFEEPDSMFVGHSLT